MSLAPYFDERSDEYIYDSASGDSDLDRAYAAAADRRNHYRDSFRRSYSEGAIAESGGSRSFGLTEKDSVAPMAGPYGSVVGGYGSSAGYANTGEGMFAAAVANLGGLFAGYDDIAAAMRQYAMFRDIPYTAIRPITVKIAGQPIHIGRKSKSASAGRDGLLTKAFANQQQSIEIVKQLAAAGLSTSTEHGAALFQKLFERIEGRIDKQSMARDFAIKQILQQAPAFVQKAAGGAGNAHDDGGAGGIEILPSHPIIDAIESPNEYMTQWALIWCTVTSLIITGRSFWWVDQSSETNRDGESGITIWYLPSSWVRPVHTRERAFDSWIVKPINTAAWMPVPAEDMVYFNIPNPANPTTMFSRMQSQSYAVSTDEEIQKAQYHAMRNIQRPGMILTAGRMELPPGMSGQGPRYTLTPEQRTQLINAIRLAYRGAVHTGEPIILDGLIESAEPYGPTPAELDFLDSSKLTKSRIMQGFGCFAPGTLIWTADGVRSIETIKEGDLVLTHKGRWRPVIRTFARHYTGDARQLRFVGAPGSVLATHEHPFLVDGEWIPAKDLRPTCGRAVGHRCEWPRLEDCDLNPRVMFAVARRRGNRSQWIDVTVDVDEELAWTMGLYLAEGHAGQAYIAWSGHVDETGLRLERISRAFDGIAQTKPFLAHESGNGVAIHLSGAGLSRWFKSAFGQKAHSKRIPSFVYRWPTFLRQAFVAGYLAGDGHEDGGCGYVTVSPQIAYGIRQLIRSFGFRTGLRYRSAKSLPVICGRQVKSVRPVYSGRISGISSLEVVSPDGTSIAESRRSQSVRQLSEAIIGMRGTGYSQQAIADELNRLGYTTRRGRPFGQSHISRILDMESTSNVTFRRVSLTVRSNECIKHDGIVHNLEVEEDNSYVLGCGAAVHNCNPIIAGEIEGANRASAYVAEDHFYSNVVNPDIELISQTLTKYLAPRFAGKGEKLYLWIEKAKPRDEDLTMAKLEFLAKFGWLEGNTARKFADIAPRPELEDLPKQPPPKAGFFGGDNIEFEQPDQGAQGGKNGQSGGRNGNPGKKPGNGTPAAGSSGGALRRQQENGTRANPKPTKPRPKFNQEASAQESQRPGRRRGGRARGRGKPSKIQTSAGSAP